MRLDEYQIANALTDNRLVMTSRQVFTNVSAPMGTIYLGCQLTETGHFTIDPKREFRVGP